MENQMKHLRVDLKICEGCGALWLRALRLESVYCRACSCRFADYPVHNPQKFRNKRRPKCSGNAGNKVGGEA